MNQSLLSSTFYGSSAYGNIDKDLIRIEGKYHTNHIMKSLPMESLRMYMREKNPLLYNFILCSVIPNHRGIILK